MRRISGLISRELLAWPGVTARPMFGLLAFYRDTTVFGMLPDKRALESPSAIAYKLPTGSEDPEGQKWRLFELNEERDVRAALVYLGKAYGQASVQRKGLRKMRVQ